MPFFHHPLPLPPSETPPLDAQATADGAWHLFFPSGDLLRISSNEEPRPPLALDLSGLDPERSLVLRIAPDGRFAAVVEEFGVRGRVFDLFTGKAALPLERGDYHSEFSAFSLAFVSHRGRTLLIHATEWNRLDITDPATGELLTTRAPTEYARDEERPEHYLDYFHGRLHLSPNGDRIAEDGWIWHPIGVPRVWSLSRWLEENVWESEDGPSIVEFPNRFYFWDGPMAWINDRNLALWGLGSDEEDMEPGIRIFDATTGEEIETFPGPVVTPQKSWPWGAGRRGWIAFDQFLYAVSPAEGSVSVWDVDTGQCRHQEPHFVPLAHHRETATFLSWRNHQLTLSHFLTLA